MEKILTVIIRDESAFIHLQEPCTYRTVHLELTPHQMLSIRLKHNEEALSHCFLEDRNSK